MQKLQMPAFSIMNEIFLQPFSSNVCKRKYSNIFRVLQNTKRSEKPYGKFGEKGKIRRFQLIRMNTQSMYKVAWAYLKNDEDVADAIQETILKCYEKLSTLKKDSYFKTWMIRILINNCNEMLRHKGRVFPTMEMEEGIFEEPGYVDCEWKEILASLDEKYQVVMLLYYSKSLSVKEIAALLEISQNTVLTRLSRARKQLRAEYEGGYIHG